MCLDDYKKFPESKLNQYNGPDEKLEFLFKEWRTAHETEKRDTSSYKDTFPYKKGYGWSDDFNKSFCRDGFITYKEGNKKTVLFVLREANISDKIQDNKLYPEVQENYFHMKKEWENYTKIETVYTKFISYWLKELGCDNCNIAYINLNKRGGFGSTNHARLKHYVKEYECYIAKEIEIINPDIIVCGGTYGIVKDLLVSENLLKTQICKIEDDYHPVSGRHKSRHRI